MKRPLLASALLFSLASLMACQEAEPQVQRNRTVHKRLVPGSVVGEARKAPSRDNVVSLELAADDVPEEAACGGGGGGAGEEEPPAECVAWVEEVDSYDPATGNFEYLNTCAEGGDLASSHTVGHSDEMGNGNYTQTYTMRDGSVIVWTFVYTLGEDQISQVYTGSSSDGTQLNAVYRYPAEGITEVDEHYVLADGGTSDSVGTYDAQGRFTGTSSYDDPATPESPDTHLTQVENDEGLRQDYTYLYDNWNVTYNAFYPAAGGLAYNFRSDDRATIALPDFDGEYSYLPDGSGLGSYIQKFDDGSTLNVEHVINTDGSYTESWVFHDATTAVDPDQEGHVNYPACGAGTGSLTTRVDGGDPETCDLHVEMDGATTVDNCR